MRKLRRKILRRRATYDKTGLGRTCTDDLEKAGKHPKRVILVGTPEKPRLIGYIEDEIDEWIAEKAAARGDA